jgi:hypothetical protein
MCHSGGSRNPENDKTFKHWIPVFTGMTAQAKNSEKKLKRNHHPSFNDIRRLSHE